MVERAQLVDGSESASRTVILAHGAGAPMDSPFMESMAKGLAGKGLRVVRFEFPYMQRRREGGKAGRPDRTQVALDHWKSVIEQVGGETRPIIGGKSFGGRMASMVADDGAAAGLVCLGYPFHPPGKPDRLRTAHLLDLRTPTLVVQGTRDPFGSPEEISGYGLPSSMRVVFLEDGDHSFKPRVKSGRTLEQNLEEAVDAIAAFAEELRS